MEETSLRLTTTSTGDTSHTPLALRAEIRVHLGRDGEIASYEMLTWNTPPAANVNALTD